MKSNLQCTKCNLIVSDVGFIWNVGYILWLYGFAISFCKRLFATAQSILYFITNENDNSLKVLPVFTGIYSIFKELFVCFCNFYKYYIERGFFRQKKIDDFSQKMTHNYLVLKMKSLSYHSPSAFFKVPKFV